MLDVKFIRENLELVEKSAKEKGYKIDVKKLLLFFFEIIAVISAVKFSFAACYFNSSVYDLIKKISVVGNNEDGTFIF